MYLKRLEIQGFKSFLSRTVFDFGPGITAVIGPNGSGKSNVSDAIRWVLGEQNPRVMRLRRADDALFAGGHKRAPAGLAEVSLWLDNSEGWLPLDYAEVVVTRRLHRSGESEYLLNRNRVRLRDVADLFLRARVGQNSYALMGQGLVDQVLSLRPEERRALLEEAADVRRFQMRIDEARDRLAATQDNLDKVELIVAEIAPRLGQLERAARRALDHERLVVELAEARIGWYGLQWREREESLVAARAAYDQRNAEFAALGGESDQLESRLASVRSDARAVRIAIDDGTARLRSLQEQVRALVQRRDLDQERLGFVRRRLEELNAELLDLGRERESLVAVVAGDEEGGPDGAIAAAHAAVEREQQALKAAEAAVVSTRRATAAAEQAERRYVAALGAIDERIERVEREARRVADEEPVLLARRTVLLQRLRDIGRESLQLRRVTVLAARDVEQADARRAEAVRRLEDGRRTADAAARALRDVRHAVDEQSRRFAMLERSREELRGVHRGAQLIVRALGEQETRGAPALGIVGELLRVPRGMEAAIEAALAEHLSAVVVQRDSDALAALSILFESAVGRATVVALDSVRPVPPLNIAKEKGVLGVASRLVKCDDRYRDLIDALLGRVVIVEDISAGRMLLKRGIQSVVTTDGVVLRMLGSITGGRNAVDGDLFSLDRDLEAIPVEVDRLLAEQERRQREGEALAAGLVELESALASATADVARAERQYAQAHTQMLALRGQLAPVSSELRYVRGALAEKDARWEERTSAVQELAAERVVAERELRVAQQQTATLRAAQREPLDRREAVSVRLAAARGTASALQQQEASLRGLRESRRAALARLDDRIAARRREAGARAVEIEAAAEDRARCDAEVLRLQAAVDDAAGALGPLQARFDSVARELAELEPRQQEIRATLADLERRALLAETEVHRRAQDVERLREEMVEEGFLFEEAPIEGTIGAVPSRPMVETRQGLAPLAVLVAERVAVVDATALQEQVRSLRARIRALGAVNTQAHAEYLEAKERHGFLTTQVGDLREAESGLQEAIGELRHTIRERFRDTFHQVNADFQSYFKTFFGGGSARLVLTEPEDYGESGVDIIARPPGKRLQSLTLLSGGERSMTAVALLFALLESNPAPFCVLDEVDAALDEANVNRFGDALRDLGARTQFVVITHNRGTIQAADTIYGVSMAADGVSNVLSLRLADVPA